MKKVSVIIPTLQKNQALLGNLVSELSADEGVSEIIVIDNSLIGYEHQSEKLRVIIPNENLYVNQSWNLGVKEAKEEIVALLNDDITIPTNFCTRIIEKISPEMGITGCINKYVKCSHEIVSKPDLEEVILKKVSGRCDSFGIAMFFYKTSYYYIPDDLKIYFGDDWLIYKNIKAHKSNYVVTGQHIYHYDGLTTGSSDKFIDRMKKERRVYNQHTRKLWNYIFSIEPMYKQKRIIILGIKVNVKWCR